MTPSRDWMTRDGSHALAVMITGYWADRNIRIETRVEQIGQNGTKADVFVVRSNLHEIRR